MQRYKVCVVGTGAAGLLILFCLSFTKIPAEDVICIDPFHDGGDLRRKWSGILSNTIWNQMLDILRSKQINIENLPSYWREIDPTKPTSLSDYIQLLSDITKAYRQQCTLYYGKVSSIHEEEGEKCIEIEDSSETFRVKQLFLTVGSDAKQFRYPIPTIPLENGFSLERLKNYVKPHHKVVVFGTAHSGTLILSNLQKLGITTFAFYKGNKPFIFARDGEYDGIKQESEIIADSILSGSYPKVSCHSLTNTADLIRCTRQADWVVYASGFEPRKLVSSYTYDGKTGKIDQLSNTWGFGIAFPNRAEDGVHWDVSIPAFFAHIEKQIPSIVESFYA